ncbi:phage tail protein [Qipengyuania marisflavi]|uniref:Phage tail protein n=1 Tax=Qipengyuania marisflavi TaxID=2486356 RepID=A0A5S3P015_9SPHN|nr:tail fiber protein [Qipengyuania marisflavi]TMM46132.1 phage tail protein [Qipengyuania marisflavi]
MVGNGKFAGFLIGTALMSSSAPPAHAQATPYLGETVIFGMNFCPRGWASASGQLLAISQNTALFSLLGTQYGGDGRTTFALPDLRGRATISYGQGGGLSNYLIGQRGGQETVTLTEATIPAHTHIASGSLSLRTSTGAPDTNDPNGAALATMPATQAGPYTTGNRNRPGMPVVGQITLDATGGSQAHENRSPYLAMNWCIATQGLFPSRN